MKVALRVTATHRQRVRVQVPGWWVSVPWLQLALLRWLYRALGARVVR